MMVPEMDGFDIRRKIRDKPSWLSGDFSDETFTLTNLGKYDCTMCTHLLRSSTYPRLRYMKKYWKKKQKYLRYAMTKIGDRQV